MNNEKMDKIVAICDCLMPSQGLTVEAFGLNHDLTLSIEKDSDYDILRRPGGLVCRPSGYPAP